MATTTARRGPGVPVPTPETQPWWDGVAEGRLLVQYFPAGGTYVFPPRAFEPETLSTECEWRETSGRGWLESFVVNHRPVPPLHELGPQVIALVRLEEGPRMVAQLRGVDPLQPEQIVLDGELRVGFEEIAGTTLPVFTPVGGVA